MGKPGSTKLATPANRGTLTQTHPQTPGPIGVGTGATSTQQSTASMGSKVVQYATQRAGQKVGDGECFALADEALKSAGAASAANFGHITPNADYIWSSQRVAPVDARPGDIIQFRNFRVYTKTVQADTSYRDFWEERPHHTAVVVSNDGSGNLTILEQNVSIGGTPGQAQKSVRQNRLVTASGTHTVGTSTVTVTISGTIVVYRPVTHP